MVLEILGAIGAGVGVADCDGVGSGDGTGDEVVTIRMRIGADIDADYLAALLPWPLVRLRMPSARLHSTALYCRGASVRTLSTAFGVPSFSAAVKCSRNSPTCAPSIIMVASCRMKISFALHSLLFACSTARSARVLLPEAMAFSTTSNIISLILRQLHLACPEIQKCRCLVHDACRANPRLGPLQLYACGRMPALPPLPALLECAPLAQMCRPGALPLATLLMDA